MLSLTRTVQRALQLALLLALLLPCWAQGAPVEVPHEIAGIALGSNIRSYPEIIDANFMKEVLVRDWHGFRNGKISYGICLHKDSILKIDMKYADRSKPYYQQLLKKFRQKYGKPSSWDGDAFGVVYIWKWQFTDQEGNRVSLTLQHNSGDSSESLGNMVKLSYPDMIAEERSCFKASYNEEKKNVDPARLQELKQSDWSHLIPR